MKASILINNYNNELYIEECINSALNQTYSNIEVIVCDNGSTDNSLQIISKYSDRIKIVQNLERTNKNNLNQYLTILKSFESATGDVIFLLDGDDCFSRKKVERIIPYFRDEKVCFVQHFLEEIDENSNLQNRKRPFLIKTENIYDYVKRTGSIISLFSPTSAQAYSKSFLDEVIHKINQEENFLVWTDLRLPYHAIFNGRIITLDESLSYYRMHSLNDSSKLSKGVTFEDFYKQCISYFNLILDFYEVSDFQIKAFPDILQFSPFVEIAFKKNLLKKIQYNKQIFIWGAGEAGRGLFKYLNTNGLHVSGFIEGNPIKHGEILDGVEVYSPVVLKELDNVIVVVSPYYAAKNIINTNKDVNKFIKFLNPYE